jgi:hypothetical protein
MTAPAIPAPAPSIGAPSSPPINHAGVYAVDDAIAEASRDAIQRTLAELDPAPEAAQPETPAAAAETPAAEATPTAREDGATWNEKAGRWQLSSGAFAEGAAPESVATPATPETPSAEAPAEPPATPALPEGLVAVKKVEGRELATKFRVLDEQGELEVPDMLIEFTANGKVRTEPLDKVIRMAEWGVYNLEREQQVTAKQHQAEQVHSENAKLTHLVAQLQQEREQLLSDDAAYLNARAAHEAKNTPEARAEAAQQQALLAQHQMEFTQAATLGQQFVSSVVEPALSMITKNLSTVSEEEIGARLLLVTNPLLVQTPFGPIMPPAAYDQVRRAILTEVVPWAQQVHDHRQSEQAASAKAREHAAAQDAARQAAEKAAAQARADAQRTKNDLTRAAKPGARAAATDARTSEPQRPKANPTVEEAEEDVVKAAIAQTLSAA